MEVIEQPTHEFDVLFLATDAYGGTGGIALYNRDAIAALHENARVSKIIVVPRVVATTLEPIPDNVVFDQSGLGGAIAYVRAIWWQIRANRKIGLIYCGHVNLIPIAYLASKWLNIPWALCLYGVEAWQPIPRLLPRVLAKYADLVISLSEVTHERFLAWCPIEQSRCCIVPNAVHLDQFKILPKDQTLLGKYDLQGRKVIMTLGRLDPVEQAKGFDRVIKMLPELQKQVPNITYLIVGKGDDKARLEAISVEYGVSDIVRYTGFIAEADKPNIYALADAYVMPSTGEGFGFVYTEAMACGIPVVGSSIDGSREALRNGMLGPLVDPFDPKALLAATLSALTQEKSIPEGLDYFKFSNFAARLNDNIDAIT